MTRTAKIRAMLRQAVLDFLDRIDPPPPTPQRHCPSCEKAMSDGSLVERGEFDYLVCVSCGEASVWKGMTVVAGEDSVFTEGDD